MFGGHVLSPEGLRVLHGPGSRHASIERILDMIPLSGVETQGITG
jgi:hypothetical protein